MAFEHIMCMSEKNAWSSIHITRQYTRVTKAPLGSKVWFPNIIQQNFKLFIKEWLFRRKIDIRNVVFIVVSSLFLPHQEVCFIGLCLTADHEWNFVVLLIFSVDCVHCDDFGDYFRCFVLAHNDGSWYG